MCLACIGVLLLDIVSLSQCELEHRGLSAGQQRVFLICFTAALDVRSINIDTINSLYVVILQPFEWLIPPEFRIFQNFSVTKLDDEDAKSVKYIISSDYD